MQATTVTTKQPTKLRAARIAAVQQALYARNIAAKQAKAAAVAAQATMVAYQQELAAMQAKYAALGLQVAPPATARNARTSAPGMHSYPASTGSNICATVHQITAQYGYNRKAALAACAAAGINKNTAQRQVGVAIASQPKNQSPT